MTATRGTNHFGPRWGRQEGCLQQRQPKSRCVLVGRSPTRPLGFIFSHRQASSPATHHPSATQCPHDAAVVPCCLVPRTSAMHPHTHRSCRARSRDKAPFSFSSAQFKSGGRERLGSRSQSPWTVRIYLQQESKSVPSLETILYTQRLFWRKKPQRICLWWHLDQKETLEKRQETPDCFPLNSSPPFQVPQNTTMTPRL